MLSSTAAGFLKNRVLELGFSLLWHYYLQFLGVISVRMINISQNGNAYWKQVPQKQFICMLTGLTGWSVTCVLILSVMKQ